MQPDLLNQLVTSIEPLYDLCCAMPTFLCPYPTGQCPSPPFPEIQEAKTSTSQKKPFGLFRIKPTEIPRLQYSIHTALPRTSPSAIASSPHSTDHPSASKPLIGVFVLLDLFFSKRFSVHGTPYVCNVPYDKRDSQRHKPHDVKGKLTGRAVVDRQRTL